MPKCRQEKNPCKICLGPVTRKTGLHCQGACDTWMHYSCLNYTPGRIQDIKAGIINVVCPCPDCVTTLPKEYRKSETYSCTNIECPANKPARCVNTQCPMNVDQPKADATSDLKSENKKYTNPNSGQKAPYFMRQPPSSATKHSHDSYGAKHDSGLQAALCECGPDKKTQGQDKQSSNRSVQDSPPRGNCNVTCSSGRSTNNLVSGDTKMDQQNFNCMPSMQTMADMCNTIELLSEQINKLLTKMNDGADDTNKNTRCCSGNCSKPESESRSKNPTQCECSHNSAEKKKYK